MTTKKIICLANSRKPPSGRCIAGKEFLNGMTQGWARPVSQRPGHEVSEEERRYESGQKVQLLDIVSVPVIQASPAGHQVENFILDAGYYWKKHGVATWAQVLAAADPYDAAFWGNSQSTYHGRRDKIAAAVVAGIGSSLKLVVVNDLVLHVRREDGYEANSARRRVRAGFTVKGTDYLLSVTDPNIEDTYLQKPEGQYPIPVAAVCVSLVEVWNGFAFKVVASIITPEMC